MQVRRIGVSSLGKILGTMYAGLGVLVGLVFTTLTLIGGRQAGNFAGNFATIPFGLAAILFLPILYGIGGFISGIITAALYNWAAGSVGGVEIEITSDGGPNSPPGDTEPRESK